MADHHDVVVLGAGDARSAHGSVVGGRPRCAVAAGQLAAGDGGRGGPARHPGGRVRLVLVQRLPVEQDVGQPVEPLPVAAQDLHPVA